MNESLFDAFELSGYWWLPSDPEQQRRGTVTFEPGKTPRLRTESPLGFGEMPKGFSFKLPDTELRPVIQGETTHGIHVVLLNCRMTQHRIYEVETLLVANEEMPFKNLDETILDKVNLYFSYVDVWLWNFPVQVSDFLDENDRVIGIQANYMIPPEIALNLATIQSRLRIVAGWSHSLGHYNNFNLTQKAMLIVEPDTPQPVAWFLDQATAIKNFLTFLIGIPVQLTSITGRNNEILDSSEQPTLIHVYSATDEEQEEKEVWPDQMVLSAGHIDAHLEEMFDLWFQLQKKDYFEPLEKLFLGTVYYRSLSSPEFVFLMLTQALETYHRRKYGGGYLTVDRYDECREALIRAIPQDIEPDHRKSLKSRIKYGYQYSLRKRLDQLFNRLDDELQPLLRLSGEEGISLGRIKSSRDYYTHYDPEDEKDVLKGRELQRATYRLLTFITVLILQDELYVPLDILKDVLKRRRESGYI